jgi:hypothetical protein
MVHFWREVPGTFRLSSNLDYKSPRGLEAIDRFIKSSDYEFECFEIVGRRFKDVGDHAGYLRDGGCSNIIEILVNA